jgi:CheY-like chemotaxis protein
MSRVLLVDDDPDQLDIRRLILEHAGHNVWTASTSADAVSQFRNSRADSVVMDLYLPAADDGKRLIRDLRELSAQVNIVVTTGWGAALNEAPENTLVNHVLQKPFKTQKLLQLLALLLLCVLPIPAFDFIVETTGEHAASVGFGTTELELAEVSLDGKRHSYIPVAPKVSIFLGKLAVGNHTLSFSRPAREVRVALDVSPWLSHAPIVHTRPSNGTRFTDIPLLTYAERLKNQQGDYFQYTVIFSNEDGGTSTRALMARWGRTTDIEHVYRVWPATGRTEIQSRGHADVAFTGRYEGKHPLLYVTTENNMVGPDGQGEVRFRLAPILVDLSHAPREKVMDDHPFTYEVAAKELQQEGKLRPFGKVDGQKISDPRNYVTIEAEIRNRGSRVGFRVRLNNEPIWRTSYLGNVQYAIERDGWIRSTIELPPGTLDSTIDEVGADCLVEPPGRDRPSPVAGECQYRSLAVWAAGPPVSVATSDFVISPTGETRTWKLR